MPNRYKFKAQELNPRILEGGLSLPKKLPAKEPTKPIGFDLEIEKRIQERESKKPPETEHFEFHSRPCPTKILEDVVVNACYRVFLPVKGSGLQLELGQQCLEYLF